MFQKRSLRFRIFMSMIILVLIASVLIAGVTIYQYREQSRDYHAKRLERKEQQIMQSIGYTMRETSYEPITENLPFIFRDEIYKIAEVQNINFNIYDLEGELLKSSRESFETDTIDNCLDYSIIDTLLHTADHRYVEQKDKAGQTYQASYNFIYDPKFKPIGILNVPYYEDNSFNEAELREFLTRLGAVYLLMLVAAVFLAFFISRYITQSLQAIRDKMAKTDLTRRNEKIEIEESSIEIDQLVVGYNDMIDELEESAAKLARSEREQAWREMARQVAHEIKNPLTPMRLSVQSFERRFDPKDPKARTKLSEFSESLIQQIDTMSNIASAFSNFAKMPAQQRETLNVVSIVKLALDIFNEPYILFMAEEEELIAKLDRTQLIRVVTNLVKNATQAMSEQKDPKVLVSVGREGKDVCVAVQDNGVGISEAHMDKIFEPKFTTKNSGMGLGLGMVRNIVENSRGRIEFSSKEGLGTTFKVYYPLEEENQSEIKNN